MKKHNISWQNRVIDRNFELKLSERTYVMGIVNVTPDSFSDGGKFYSHDKAVAHGLKLAEDGADILDIGGESTRPFSESVPADEELRRIIPVIEKLADKVDIPISIDTTKAIVAEEAVKAGASIINDISALGYDSDMADTAARYDVPLILMHIKGTPEDMQMNPDYDDLFEEISGFLLAAVKRAEQSGVSRSRIIIDPGIGFGKKPEHNLQLIKHLDRFDHFDLPVLVGPSRKTFIRHLLGDEQGNTLTPDQPLVEIGSQASFAAAAMNGAHILRVHNVANTCATLKIIDAIKNAI